jgi:hypothetical protein
MMRRWSNDRFLSTPHGVLNESGTDRYSIAYFHSPNPDAVIECLPSCVSAGQSAALLEGGVPRPGPRFLPGELFPPEGPPLGSRRSGRRGIGEPRPNDSLPGNLVSGWSVVPSTSPEEDRDGRNDGQGKGCGERTRSAAPPAIRGCRPKAKTDKAKGAVKDAVQQTSDAVKGVKDSLKK